MKRASAAAYTAVYVVVGSLWVLITDHYTEFFSALGERFRPEHIQTSKGLFYVAATGVLVYVLVRAAITTSKATADRLERLVANRTEELQETQFRIEALNRELESRNRGLKLSNRDLTTFSYSISHDLRAPLRAINGFTAIVLERYGQELSQEAFHYLENIGVASERMKCLIEDLLRYARLGTTSVHTRPIPFHRILQRIAEEKHSELTAIGATLLLPHGEIVAQADPTLLWQILSNLVNNAILYRSEQRPLEIRISVEQQPGSLRLLVKDNGVGMSAENLERIFGIFQRLGNVPHSGTGVGLTIARRAAEILGGSLTVSSEPDKGSTFLLVLPTEVTK